MPSVAPEIIAHRGTPRSFPENSLPGFAHALALGVDAIELDVHLTRDGIPVVHHDADLGGAQARQPLAGRSIVDLTAGELATHRLAEGVGVPTLAEVCALVAGRATLYVEVKGAAAEAAVAAALAPFGQGTPVHGFDHRVPARVRAMSPETPVGVLSASYLVDSVAAMAAAGARDLWQHWPLIDSALVDAVHAAGGRVVAWTVNDLAHARHLAALGVDGICTDLPGEMLAQFGRARR